MSHEIPKPKEPRWMATLAVFLATVSGVINVVGFLGVRQRGITHLTGAATATGRQLVQGNAAAVLSAFGLIAGFILGAALGGVLTPLVKGRESKRIGVVLVLEAALLLLALSLLKLNYETGEHVAAMAMGLQNGMTMRWHGVLLRTTHVTGIATELGVALGNALRGQRPHIAKLTVFLLIFGSYMLGALVGTVTYGWLGLNVLMLPALCVALTGVYFLLTRVQHLSAEEHLNASTHTTTPTTATSQKTQTQ